MKLTSQQQQVLDNIKTFLDSDVSVFILKGYAGTGKTTMIRTIIEEIKNREKKPILMAPTGRAARVLESKNSWEANTIHRCIYELDTIETKEGSDDIRFIFPLKNKEDEANDHICIVDESSMIGTREVQNELFEFGTGSLLNDLLTYVAPNRGGKIIFVGDPMQLPPVGDNVSNALDEKYFESIGLKAMVSELTDVVRQGAGSAILSNAMKVRALIESQQKNNLVFDRQENEVIDMEGYKMPEQLLSLYPKPEIGQSVIIAFSNRQARDYNYAVREMLYPEQKQIVVGDILQVVSNNYKLNVMNGDFVKIVAINGETEYQSAPVYINIGGQRMQHKITLSFRNVRIRLDNELEISCKIIENMLDDADPNLTFAQIQALYINFCMRYPQLKRGSHLFKEYLKADPYFNALRVKYGYAITGHKSQGGEWNTVFVDYTGRTGLNDDSLRWAYTVTTRAKHTLYVTNLPHVMPFDKFRIDNISKCKTINAEFRVTAETEPTPFHPASSENYLKAKYHCVTDNMNGTPYSIVGVISKPYLEVYQIQTPQGVDRYDIQYKAGGVFMPAKFTSQNEFTQQVLMLLNDESRYPFVFRYAPSDEIHGKLYNLILSACDSLSIQMTNVVEHPEDFSVVYYMRTSGTISYLKVYIDMRGFVSYAKPMSMLGVEDGELNALIKEINNRMK